MGINSLSEPITKIVELDLSGLSREQKTIAKEEAGRIIVDAINDYLDQSKSPVAGGSFTVKKADGERSILFQDGDLRDSIEAVNRRGDQIEVGVFKPKEIPKAYNHNIGDTLPQRQFIPGENQEFKKDIVKKVDSMIESLRGGEPVKRERKKTAKELFDAFISATSESDTGLFNFPTVGDLISTLEEE